MTRLAVVVSHPIQYHAPWYRALANVTDLTVFFCHKQDAHGQAAAGFSEPFEWDVPLLEGYQSAWLTNCAPAPGVDRFSGCDTPDIGRHLANGRFDACIVSGWYLKSYLQAMRACRAQGIRLLVRGDSHLLERRSRWRALVKHWPYRWMLSRVDGHLCVGQANRDYLRHYGVREERLFNAPHFVDNDRFASGAAAARATGDAERLRSAWGAVAGDTLFLFVGKLTPLKRTRDFVASIANAAARNPRVRGAVIGSGPEEASLQQLAASVNAPVAFHGFVNQSALPACYAAADCLVVPSESESWGLVVNEAMATGLPAIVTERVGCAPDLIEFGETGFTYGAGDLEMLPERLLGMSGLLLENRSRVTEAVLARVSRYTCDRAVEGVLSAVRMTPRPVSGAVVAGKGHA